MPHHSSSSPSVNHGSSTVNIPRSVCVACVETGIETTGLIWVSDIACPQHLTDSTRSSRQRSSKAIRLQLSPSVAMACPRRASLSLQKSLATQRLSFYMMHQDQANLDSAKSSPRQEQNCPLQVTR